MAWQHTPYAIPMVAVGSAAAISALIIWRNRRVPEAGSLALCMAAAALWSFAYMMQLECESFAAKVFWAKLKYFGIVLAPTAWVVLALQYSGKVQRLSARNLALLAIMPVATLLLVWTNDFHHLFWTSVTIDYSGASEILFLKVGVVFWICISYPYLLLSLGIFVLCRAAIHSSRLYRRQAAFVLLGALVPIGANVIYLAGFSPVNHLDPTPFAFAISCVACAWGIFRHRLMDIVPVAHNAVIKSMKDIVFVLDARNRVVALNPSAEKILGPTYPEAVGQPANQALGFWPKLAENCENKTEVQTEVVLGEGGAERTFELDISSIRDRFGDQTGRLVILREMTEQAKTEKAQRESEARYRMLVEEATDIICTVDLKTGIITGANNFAAKILGYDMEDVVNKLSFLELVHHEDHEKVLGRLHGLAIEKKRAPSFPLRLRKVDGSYFHAEINGAVTYDAVGNPETFIGVIRDVTEQKKAEEALKESEKRYRTLVDNSLTGIFLMQDGKYQFVNKRLVDISGYSQEELVGMAFENVIHPDDVKLVQKIIGRRMTGKYPGTQYQFRIVTKSGDVLWIETFGAPVEYQGKPALLVNLIDITERRMAEEALRLTQFTVDHSPDAVYWIAPDAGFLYVNEAACHVLGYTREELLSMSVHDIDPKFTTEVWPEHWEELKERGSFTVETHHRTKEGRAFPVEVTVNYLQFMGKEYNCAVAHDITNRKQAEEQIRQSEEKYRTLFEESKDCVFITAPQGAFLDINPAGVEMFGYSSKVEVLRADLARDVYVNPADRDIFQKMMVREGFVKDYELPLKKKDGSELVVLVTANADRDDEGSVVAYRGIMRDITEQKRLEQQLFQVQKMEGIGTLAGGIAHDFNNILGGILGYASFMKTKMDEEHPFFNYIDTIERGAMRAAELTAQLLAFARGGKYETRPIDLNRIVDETLKLIGKTFDKSIEIETRLQLELPTVEADAAQMHQVLMNLCVNASDAMPDGGRLIIETSVQEFSEQYAKTQMASKSGAYVCMSVTDSGIGMDKESMQRMFEPFFTTKEHGKGTGLGLSMVYGVVKNHGGFLNVYSKVGKGTTVKVYLPASGKTETIRPTRTEALTGGNELILVVDDEEPIRSLAKEILEAYGYRVLLAEDGVGAVNVFKEHMDDINLVILDMVMPRMGGREAFLQMRQLDPQTKALLSTGYSQDGRAQEILDNGVMGFVQKPYQVEVLLLIVRKVLDAKLGAKI